MNATQNAPGDLDADARTIAHAALATYQDGVRSMDTYTSPDGIPVMIGWNVTWHSPSGDMNADNVNHGHIVSLADPMGSFPRKEYAHGQVPGRQVWVQRVQEYTQDYVTALYGLDTTLEEITAAVAVVLDTARSIRVQTDLAAQRRTELTSRQRDWLTSTAAAVAAAEPGWDRMTALENRRHAVAVALATRLLSPAAIATAAGVTEDDVHRQQGRAETEDFADRYGPVRPLYLDVRGVASRLGVSESTVRAYAARGQMPEADPATGRWDLYTVERWIRGRRAGSNGAAR